MNKDDDDITRAFAEISPSDFATHSEHFFEHTPGPEGLQELISRHLYALRYGFFAADGAINPIVALSDGRVERLFSAQDGETVGGLGDRLRRLAHETGSTRLFFSRLVPTATAQIGQVDAGEDQVRWEEALLWYAEDAQTRQQRQGAMKVLRTPRGVLLGDDVEFAALGGILGDLMHAILA